MAQSQGPQARVRTAQRAGAQWDGAGALALSLGSLWEKLGPAHKGPALGCQPLPSLPKLYTRLALPLAPGPWSSSKGPSWLPGPPPGQGWTFWGHSEIPQASLLGLSAGRRENQRQWADKGCIVAHGWGSLDLCPWEAGGESGGGRLGGWA